MDDRDPQFVAHLRAHNDKETNKLLARNRNRQPQAPQAPQGQRPRKPNGSVDHTREMTAAVRQLFNHFLNKGAK